MRDILLRGTKKGLDISWELVIKIVLPVYILVSILQYTPVVGWLSNFLSPFMAWFGLPGEASLALVIAMLSNAYAGIAVALSLHLGTKELTVIAAMLLMAHELPMEAAVSKKSGSRVTPLIIIRLVLALAFGFIANQIF
ncbi:MAG: nucleoside recognition domain-containing protein [Bacillota bacterium]|nr:nucleoside recognition domain-containing protein [Bacillota bacterium]